LEEKLIQKDKMKQTAVEWLAEKYNYVTWLRNRDEISAGLADEWRKHYLEVAKEMEKDQIKQAYLDSSRETCLSYGDNPPHDDPKFAEKYYQETFNTKKE
jgi:hypothetical protein